MIARRRLLLAALLLACARKVTLTPPESHPAPIPVAPREPSERTIHGRTLSDPYAWMRDRDDPRVREYLEAENAYSDDQLRERAPLAREILDEMRARVPEIDETVPERDGELEYFTRTTRLTDYPVQLRRRVGTRDEEVILDANVLARDHAYYDVVHVVAPTHDLVAYAVDTVGDERYTLHVREIATERMLTDGIADVDSFAWAADGRTILYTRLDAANRPFEVRRHVVGGTGEDPLVLREDDDAFRLEVWATRSRAFIVVESESQTSTELHVVPTGSPADPPRLVAARQPDVELRIDHHGADFWLAIDDAVAGSHLVTVPVASPQAARARSIVAARPEVAIVDVQAFAQHVAIVRRREGRSELVVIDRATGREHVVAQPEPAHELELARNLDVQSDRVRFRYSSFVTPPTVFEHDMRGDTTKELRRMPVPGFDASTLAQSEHIAKAGDGTAIPISAVHPREPGPRPFLVTAYGAYGVSFDPAFSSPYLSLVSRGIGVAICHVRGGGERGRAWYEAGKLRRKATSVSDLVACREALVRQGLASPDRLALWAESAGGLVLGAVLNEHPELFTVAVADVPFVDLLNTMLDPSLPLTVMEYGEWGDPRDPADFAAMSAYSPYDNVGAHAYPALLVLAGWTDTRVGYWEAAKWVARIRATRTDDRELVLRTDLGAGHGGPTARDDTLWERALVLAFVVDHLGLRYAPAPAR